MKHRDAHSKTSSSFWLEDPVRHPRAGMLDAAVDRPRASIAPGFLAHHRSVTTANDLKKNFIALDFFRRAKAQFTDRLCQESMSKDAAVLRPLASESMFDFAEFYYAIHAMGLRGHDDAIVLLDMHNARVASLATAPRGTHDLTGAFFSDVDLMRLEEIWRDMPGSLEQSILARFLAPYMSEASVHRLVVACEAAGFVTRTATVRNCVVVSSVGLMEEIMTECLRDLRSAISEL